jgi:hypothetical protein
MKDPFYKLLSIAITIMLATAIAFVLSYAFILLTFKP